MNYIFEDAYKTLFETNDFNEMKFYLCQFSLEQGTLEYSDIYEGMNYTIIHFYGYNLMIKKEITIL